MHALPNRPTLEAIRNMPLGDIVALPAEHLAFLQSDPRQPTEAARPLHAGTRSPLPLPYPPLPIAAQRLDRQGERMVAI